MTHKLIEFVNVGLSFPHKTCFENFNTTIVYGSRIGIIGQNGSGKSTLLKMLQRFTEPTDGHIKVPDDVRTGYVAQVIEDYESLSGGQRLNAALTQALAIDPTLLLLDEPTNHLDRKNRQSLMRMLRSFPGTLVVVSHDTELLHRCVDALWHIDNGRVHIFSGNYEDYRREISIKRGAIEKELSSLDRQKKEAHQDLMKEQERTKKSNQRGEKSIQDRKWPTIVSDEKARRAIETSGKKKNAIRDKKQGLTDRLSELRLPEILKPKFSLTAADIGDRTIVSINEGSVGYDAPIVDNITVSLFAGDRLAIVGDNGSGKSTLIRAILGDARVTKSGQWHIPKRDDIGILDQHYETLDPQKTVLGMIHDLAPTWSHADIRRHLNDFLFRKNEEVNALVSSLSGGEKARLSLAQIGAKTPKLLILDEMTNNIDLETRDHVVQILKGYPGTLIAISHDDDFLKAIGVEAYYCLN
ncbi:ABC-F family ATP-binding cassette domain-containing protein [Candidatus Finniella inopinata]|uniref:ABC-F family ATP-binding cassette domain-containing protein n=1 Tax=Candidatus Finniella inopinata TaxID=1696036 RepID=A0A4Q7DJF4_9PROT|nr:ATP-binding cassette domain-containing protein [Candidatus Finniella inopinata]RZI46285.1 ABC-F family ATP-binding cassette domain-containing protein [Candidatus Finniella inopinata]